jgi:hypothetical protein
MYVYNTRQKYDLSLSQRAIHASGKYVTLAIEPRFRDCDVAFN